MTTKLHQSVFAICACLGFAIPQAQGSAPAAINSITVKFNGTSATYSDDLGPFDEELTKSDLTTGPFRYERVSATQAKLIFTNWTDEDETYTGTFTLTFTSATTGTFYKIFSGTFNGYISGTFKIVAMDVPGRPVALAQTVRVNQNERVRFRLKGRGLDVRKSGLVFKITQEPKLGKLITKNLPIVAYQPKPGFTGTVKFTFIVKEGNSVSKPATVKLLVE